MAFVGPFMLESTRSGAPDQSNDRRSTVRYRESRASVVAIATAVAVCCGLMAAAALGQSSEDGNPPQTEITSGPGNGDTIADTTPTFEFQSDEAGSTFACSVDEAAFAACTSPHTTAALAAGRHSFAVQATDAAGNTDKSPDKRNFTVELATMTCRTQPATIVGTDKADSLVGTSSVDVIVGLGGNDEIAGGAGNDFVCAQGGNDLVNGGGGDDFLQGGAGDDRLSGRAGDDRLVGFLGTDRCRGGLGTDIGRGCERSVGIP